MVRIRSPVQIRLAAPVGLAKKLVRFFCILSNLKESTGVPLQSSGGSGTIAIDNFLCRRGSVVEQLIRNQQVVSSNLIVGSNIPWYDYHGIIYYIYLTFDSENCLDAPDIL